MCDKKRGNYYPNRRQIVKSAALSEFLYLHWIHHNVHIFKSLNSFKYKLNVFPWLVHRTYLELSLLIGANNKSSLKYIWNANPFNAHWYNALIFISRIQKSNHWNAINRTLQQAILSLAFFLSSFTCQLAIMLEKMLFDYRFLLSRKVKVVLMFKKTRMWRCLCI